MSVPISNVVRRVVFAPSGTGPYAFTFEILAATDIQVYKGDTLLTLTTDYSVTINTNGTGSVTLVVTAGTDNITIVGARTIQRTTDFVTGGDLFANSLNTELDSLTIFTQQNSEANVRSIKAPVTDPTTINMILPTKTDRANKVLSFNSSTGNPETTITVTAINNAASDAAAAAASASAAASSASAASGSASAAAGSASSASSSASSATSSASAASASASAASTSESNAASSASAASTSASNASTSASNASTSASNAANSATAAQNAQTAAESARDSTLAAFDSFDDRYLGTKTSDPTLDNDGNALVAGALYFNSVSGIMKVYTGSAWVAAYVSGTGFVDLASAQTITGVKTFDNGLSTDTISEETAAAGVTVDGVLLKDSQVSTDQINEKTSAVGVTIDSVLLKDGLVGIGADGTASAPSIYRASDTNTGLFFPAADQVAIATNGVERVEFGNSETVFNDGGADVDFRVEGDTNANLLFVDASTDRVGIGTSSPAAPLQLATAGYFRLGDGTYYHTIRSGTGNESLDITANAGAADAVGVSTMRFLTSNGTAGVTEKARITGGGNLLVGYTGGDLFTFSSTGGFAANANNRLDVARQSDIVFTVNRTVNDGGLVEFYQAGTLEGGISVSGNTVSYNAFSGAHWSQLQQGRGYNPDIPRGTVMSTTGEMCLWKSVEWTKTIEHEATEEKEAWTETLNKRETYLGDLPVGATFEEDGFTKTVVDDGNERLPKVKISDVVGDKAVYGVFQTWDDVEDMLVTSLGAFVVRIAAGITVEIGDLLESNGDGCAKVQDDDVIRSKTIAKVTSTAPTETYEDGSYTVPAVIYCG